MSKDTELSDYLSGTQISLTEVVSRVNAGANPNVLNRNGDTALHLAIACRAPHTLIFSLLSVGAHVTVKNSLGLSPLQHVFQQHPIDLDTAFLLIKEGANPKTVDLKGDNLIHHAIFYGDLSSLAMAIKLGSDARIVNNSGYTPLRSLMSQQPVNLHAVALLVFAASGALIKSGSLNVPLVKYDHIIDTNSMCTKSQLYIDRRIALELGKYQNNKEKVFHYLTSLPSNIQKELVNQALDKNTLLGAFFYVQRGMFKTNASSGTLEQLMKLQKQLNKKIDPTLVRVVHTGGLPQQYEPSAPPAFYATTGTSDYNPMMFASQSSAPLYTQQLEDQTGYRKT